jgi:hypothetical protein
MSAGGYLCSPKNTASLAATEGLPDKEETPRPSLGKLVQDPAQDEGVLINEFTKITGTSHPGITTGAIGHYVIPQIPHHRISCAQPLARLRLESINNINRRYAELPGRFLLLPKKEEAEKFFKFYIRPRRVRVPETYGNKSRWTPRRIGSDQHGGSYSWNSNMNKLKEFGPGIFLYFRLMRDVSIFLLLLMIPLSINATYFVTNEYSSVRGTTLLTMGSAVCNSQKMVKMGKWTAVLPDETSGDWRRTYECPLPVSAVLVQWYCTIAVVVFFLYFTNFRIRVSTAWTKDNSKRTARHSVLITNPPPDAADPDEWFMFFSQFGAVAAITVVLDNADLQRKMMDRRRCRREVEKWVSPGVTRLGGYGGRSLWDEGFYMYGDQLGPRMRVLAMKFGLFRDLPYLEERQRDIGETVLNQTKSRGGFQRPPKQSAMWKGNWWDEDNWVKREYKGFPVAQVFVVFDHEVHQERCLLSLVGETFADAFFRTAKSVSALAKESALVIAREAMDDDIGNGGDDDSDDEEKLAVKEAADKKAQEKRERKKKKVLAVEMPEIEETWFRGKVPLQIEQAPDPQDVLWSDITRRPDDCMTPRLW